MSTLLSEKRLSLSELARQENKSVPTCWRWAKRGVRGVVLETVHVGGRCYTSREAFARFVDGTTAAAQGAPLAPKARTNRQREAAIKRAEAALDDAGI